MNRAGRKSKEAFRTISEAAGELDVPQHVLRFWETRFTQIKPMKRAGNRRYYRPEDVKLLEVIRHHLYDDGYTIKGVQKLLKEKGVRSVLADWSDSNEALETVAVSAPKPAAAEPVTAQPSGVSATDAEIIRKVLGELKALRDSLDDL